MCIFKTYTYQNIFMNKATTFHIPQGNICKFPFTFPVGNDWVGFDNNVFHFLHYIIQIQFHFHSIGISKTLWTIYWKSSNDRWYSGKLVYLSCLHASVLLELLSSICLCQFQYYIVIYCLSFSVNCIWQNKSSYSFLSDSMDHLDFFPYKF